MSETVLAAHRWPTNGHLIADVARLGYLTDDMRILDPTYGEAGVFWKVWRPAGLVTHDIKLDRTDVAALPYADGEFDAVVFDPPYKLNGTPDPRVDRRYGVDEKATWQERHQLIRNGIAHCARVLKPKGHLLVKCMDQVVSGEIRWQTDMVTEWAVFQKCRKVDEFLFLGNHRPQPMEGRTQRHAHGRPSSLLVFRKEAPRV